MSRQIRWGFIGCGDVVEKKSFPSAQSTDMAEVVAVLGRTPTKVEDFARRHGVERCYTDIRAFLADRDIEAVYIATPPAWHCEYTLLAAEAGKHILCEKPMALSVLDAEKMIRTCKENKVHLMIAYYRRFYPHVIEIRNRIMAGWLGKIVQARMHLAMPFNVRPVDNWRYDPKISGGGLLPDIGSHRLDTLIYLLGDVSLVSGMVVDHKDGITESIVASVRFKSDCLASVSADADSANRTDTIEIYGTAGCVVANPLERFRLSVMKGGEEEIMDFFPPAYSHKSVFEHFAKVVYREEANVCAGEDGVKVTEVMESIFVSAHQGQTIACRC